MSKPRDPYRELFERSADAILIIEGGRFVDCNDATVRMLRYESREELLQTHPSELSPPTQPDGRSSFDKANEMIALAFERGNHRFEWMHMRADGEVFPVEVLLTAVEEADRSALHVVWRDITNRKQLEEQLRHAQKMEAVGRLAGGIAHDFNNLLVVILGHVELLSEHAQDDPAIAEHAQAIEEAGNRAAALVKQLLAFGRKQQRLPEVFDLNGLVDHLQGMLVRLIGEDLELETTLSDEPLLVEADAGQLEQVILNLATNARDASPAGGTLRLVLEAVEIPASPAGAVEQIAPGRYARLAVTDTGTGMSPEVVARAFDPFYTTKEATRGTGLGLSTSHSIIEQSHGHIGIDSTPGLGTTVSIHLPLSAKAENVPPIRPLGPSSGPRGGHGARVLVVEDDPAVRGMILRCLRLHGYEVFAAADGIEGAELYVRHAGTFDLVVSDVIMPRSSGPNMVAALAERGHHPRVLYLSGYTDDALSEMHRVGVEIDLLEKPFAPEQLAARVRRAIDRGGSKNGLDGTSRPAVAPESE